MSPLRSDGYIPCVPAGIYIHVPFCRHRCPYCNFTLIETDGSHQDLFRVRIREEIEQAPHPFAAASLYFGGGTPSLLSPDAVADVIDLCRSRFHLPDSAEITLEANPEDADPSRLRHLHSAGINRLSFGIQSFHPDELRFLGRHHTPKEGIESVITARNVGFENLNLDLMFGLPGGDEPSWVLTLQQALRLRPEHFSLYSLTYEPGTPLGRSVDQGSTVPISDDLSRSLYLRSMDLLQDSGYRHYEISNFARPGRESAHNLVYWTRNPYLGFGPGAHSFIPERRWWNHSNVPLYLRGERTLWKEELLTPEQIRVEALFLGLRLSDGLPIQDEFRARYDPVVTECVREGLAEIYQGRFRLTRSGRCVADAVIGRFVAS